MKTLKERATEIAQKAVAKKAEQTAVPEANKPAKGKKLTLDQEVARLKAMHRIVDE